MSALVSKWGWYVCTVSAAAPRCVPMCPWYHDYFPQPAVLRVDSEPCVAVMWSVNHLGGGVRGVWMSCWFPEEKKRGVFVPGRAGSTAGLFSIVCPNWTAQHTANPPPSPRSHPQHLIRQLTPPSVVSAGGSAACQMLGWESLLFWRMNVCFFFSLSLSFCCPASPRAKNSDHLANGDFSFSLLSRLNLCRQLLHLVMSFCVFQPLSASRLHILLHFDIIAEVFKGALGFHNQSRVNCCLIVKEKIFITLSQIPHISPTTPNSPTKQQILTSKKQMFDMYP